MASDWIPRENSLMAGTRRTSFTGRFALVVAAASLGATALSTTASGQDGELRAAEGDWVGQVSFVNNGIAFAGGFEFASAGGSVEGSFGWAGGGAQISGVVSGPDTMPVFTLTDVISLGEVIDDVTGGGEIELSHASCERLEGRGVNIQAGIEPSEQVWWAMRLGAAPEPETFFDALQTLQLETRLLVDDIVEGRIIIVDVYAELESKIGEAERLAAELDRTAGCGDDFYRSLIAFEVERLLFFVLSGADIDVFTFAQIILATVRSGTVSGSGPLAADLLFEARAAFNDRLADAFDAGDEIEIIILGAVAEQLGWTDEASAAAAVLEVLAE